MKITWAIPVLIISILIPFMASATPCSQNFENIAHDAYPQSIALLAAAQCEDAEGYKKIRASFITTLPMGLLTGQSQTELNTPFNILILGRLAFSDKLQKYPDQKNIAKLLNSYLLTILPDTSSEADLGDDTAMRLWGYAYAIAANPELYQNKPLTLQDLKEKTLLALQNKNLLDTNKGWIITTDLLAAAAAKDQPFYDFGKKFIIEDKVIENIALSEYRNWAWAMVRQAALQMQDTALFDMATTQYQATQTILQTTPVKNPQTQALMMLIGTTSFDYTTSLMPVAAITPPPATEPAETPDLMPADLGGK